jgi:hypothetical protein
MTVSLSCQVPTVPVGNFFFFSKLGFFRVYPKFFLHCLQLIFAAKFRVDFFTFFTCPRFFGLVHAVKSGGFFYRLSLFRVDYRLLKAAFYSFFTLTPNLGEGR